MRTIKFRFWNKLARRFQPPSKYAIDGEGKLVSYDYEVGRYDDPIDFSNSIIVPQQFTGLKDKNGKEIYEGDIVSYGKFFPNCEVYYETKSVCFKHRIYGTEGLSEKILRVDSFTKKDLKNFEVVGNIYENPELLQKS